MADGADPERIRSIAVHTDDIVAAYEAARGGRPAVIRVTPPFAGRMRGRLHVALTRDDPEAIHIEPSEFLTTDAPSYPTVDSTAAALRTAGCEYTTDAHHAYHVERVEDWRETVREHLVDEVPIDTPSGVRRIAVKRLG